MTQDPPAPPEGTEPDDNPTGLPRCHVCGDVTYRPEPVSGRKQARRCAGCHFTTTRCECPGGRNLLHLAATPEPLEDGWEELRRAVMALPGHRTGAGFYSPGWISRRAVLDLLGGEVAALLTPVRGEPPEPGPVIDVERLATAMRRILVPTLDDGDLEIAVPAIATEYDRLRP